MKIITFKKGESGTLNPVSDRVYFPRSEYHCRYPGLFNMKDSVRWSTYHRSDFKQIEGTNKNKFKFLGNQVNPTPGMYSKTGNYYNPFYFDRYKKALKPIESIKSSKPASWYDRLLDRQKKIAAHVVEQVKEKDPTFIINSDNSYTCVLFTLPKPKEEKNPKIWSQFLSVYLIALANKLAHERGINIEMVHRSSFGCIRPSVAECGKSVRVNLGLSPKPYVECVIDAIFYLKKLVEHKKAFKISFAPQGLIKKLEGYNESNSTTKKTVNIQLKDTLWDTLWAPGDSSNKSFASQIFRKSIVVEWFVDLVMDGCLNKPLEHIFSGKDAFTQAFINPLKIILRAITLVKTSISIHVDSERLKTYEWGDAQPVDDEEFWAIVADMAKDLGATKSEVMALTSKRITTDLHSRLEALSANFVFQPVDDNSVTDGNGSDSDGEGEFEINGDPQPVYAKKLITATGMRAIQLIHAVSRNYLSNQYQVDPLHIKFNANQMYYETDEALSKHPIPIHYGEHKNKGRNQRNVSFFDLNHCNTTHEDQCDPIDLIDNNDRICAIDITSATTQESHDILIRLYESRPNLEVILMISSGLKNEQAMGDYNPYGTVRIFSKSSESLDIIYADLVSLEKDAGYLHPKESHLIRKTAKLAGMTPTNLAILNC